MGGGHAGGQLGLDPLGVGDVETASVRVIWPDGEGGRRHGRGGHVRDPSTAVPPRSSHGRRRHDACADRHRGASSRQSTFPTSGCPPPCRRSAGDVRGSPCPAARAGQCRGLRSPRRLRRSRAQRQPVVPYRLRPALRGGAADRGSRRRAGDPGRQRVLGHGRRRATADAAASVPGLQPAEPAARPLATLPRSWPTRASARAAALGWSGGRRTARRNAATCPRTWSMPRGWWASAGSVRTPPAC